MDQMTSTPVFSISADEVQEIAQSRLRRQLSDDEMHFVRKNVSWGLIWWTEIVSCAVDNAVKEARELSYHR